jgi:hypothetical protein
MISHRRAVPSLPDRVVLLVLALLTTASLGATEPRTSDPSFPPLRRPRIPAVKESTWARNPLDAFILARLEQAGLRPNPSTDKITLLRRVTYDLTGLVPTLAEREAFLADSSPNAYERVVDRLLDSPHFGERWAQHWLDVVRYAESDGFKLDSVRPEAYRYRDYVIDTFNRDLPYDRFISQQLAGDELEPENPEALIATGFFRLPPEEVNGSNYRMVRQDILDDLTDVFSAAFLGLTVGCARCHDHKFDPIPQKDYYRLQAFFAPLLQRDDLPLASPGTQAQYAKRMASYIQATRPVRQEMEALLEPVKKALFEESVVVFDPDTQTALRTSPGKRTALQKQLAGLASKQIERKYARMSRRLAPKEKACYEELQKKLALFDGLRPPPLPSAQGVCDAGREAPLTQRLAGGSYLKPREEVQPRFLSCLGSVAPAIIPPERVASTGRRSALARWLCRPDHPQTARVIVNRIWQQYLGQGIVATPNDFGVMGERATHPELLDYLASELVRTGWRLKPLHRLIVTSATYRQASALGRNPTVDLALKADTDDKLLWHAHLKRRDGESIRDVVLQLSGKLSTRMFGPSARPELPEQVMESRYSWYADERPQDRKRRSIYVLARRNLPYPLFAVFDQPDRHTSCPARAITTTPPQALAMLNGDCILAEARGLGEQLLTGDRGDVPTLIRDAYLQIFSREPDKEEMATALRFLKCQTALIAEGTRTPPPWTGPLPTGVAPALAGAVVDFCHALLNSAEFLYLE